MPEEQKKHPLEEYSENEQVAYLSILSAICYADKEFGDKEKGQLDSLLAQLEISDIEKAKIYSSVFNLPHENKLANLEAIQNLGDTELKYTLISDLCLFSLVDEKFTDEEYQYILGIGELLEISQEQVDAIKSVQENLYRIKDIPSNSERLKRVIKDSTANLAGVGVPIGAIAASGSVFGLSAAGMTSGLAALGALVGGGMLAGAVVVVPAIAVGSAYGVKKLFDVAWKDKENADDEKPTHEKGGVKKLFDVAWKDKENADDEKPTQEKSSVKKLLDGAWRGKENSDDDEPAQEKGRKWSWTKKA